MSKKVLLSIGSILAVVIIAGAAVGGLVLLRGTPAADDTPPAPASPTFSSAADQQEAQTTPDLSLDLGACSVIEKSQIEAALPSALGDFRDADNRGVGNEPGGARSQSCVYRLEDGQALTNRFTVTVTKYADEATASLAKEGYTEPVQTSLSGAQAFAYNEVSDQGKLHMVIVFTKTTSVMFALQLPADQEEVSTENISASLIQLANGARL